MPVKKKIDHVNKHRLARANGQIAIKEVIVDGKSARVLQMQDNHLLDLLRTRGQIDDGQYRAGLTFYRDWYLSGVSGAKAIDYSVLRVDTSTVKARSHGSLDAMSRWNDAVRAIGKVHCSPVVDMVLLELSPEQYGRDKCRQNNAKLARLAALTLLGASLDALREHYRY